MKTRRDELEHAAAAAVQKREYRAILPDGSEIPPDDFLGGFHGTHVTPEARGHDSMMPSNFIRIVTSISPLTCSK